MKKLTYHLGVFALSIVLMSCGPEPKKDNIGDSYSNSPQTLELQVGTNFLNAPNNELKFGNLQKGVPQYRFLTYKALSKGNLVISKSSTGLGVGCGASDADVDYNLDYQFHLKNSATGLYDISTEPVDSATKEILPTIALERGDELKVTVAIMSRTNCSGVNLWITSVFNAKF